MMSSRLSLQTSSVIAITGESMCILQLVGRTFSCCVSNTHLSFNTHTHIVPPWLHTGAKTNPETIGQWVARFKYDCLVLHTNSQLYLLILPLYVMSFWFIFVFTFVKYLSFLGDFHKSVLTVVVSAETLHSEVIWTFLNLKLHKYILYRCQIVIRHPIGNYKMAETEKKQMNSNENKQQS